MSEILMAALIFVPLQLAIPQRPAQRVFRKQWLSDVVCTLCNAFFIPLGLAVLTTLLLPHMQAMLPGKTGAFILRQPLWIQAPAAFVISDIGYYVMHRLFHAVPFLWRFHAIHHGIEELDWLAAHRVHPVDQILTTAASILPVMMLGFSLPAMAIYSFVHLIQSHLVHANARIGFGPLRYVFASPLFHHWHHAKDPAARDRNFSARLILLDVIGGTFRMPDEMPSEFGIEEPVPEHYPRQLIYPFLRPARAAAFAMEPMTERAETTDRSA